MSSDSLLVRVAYSLGVIMIVMPLAGGGILLAILQTRDLNQYGFIDCWKSFVGANAYGCLTIASLGYVPGVGQKLRETAPLGPVLILGVVAMIIVPLFMAKRDRKVIESALAAVIAVNALAYLFLFR